MPWSGATLLSFDAHPPWYPVSAALKDESRIYTVAEWGLRGGTQRPNGENPDVLYACPDMVAEQIDRMPCTNNPGYMSAAPRSNHIGGVCSAFLDGSVHFLANDIDELLMVYLIATSDDQIIEPPQ